VQPRKNTAPDRHQYGTRRHKGDAQIPIIPLYQAPHQTRCADDEQEYDKRPDHSGFSTGLYFTSFFMPPS